MKISLVGIGRVGSTLGFALVVKSLADELVLVSRNHDVAVGEALDLSHASSLVPEPVQVYAGEIADTSQSDIIVMCASVPLEPQHTSRHDLAAGNVEIFCEYIPKLVAYSPDACLLIITNPVDVMTYVAWKLSGLEPHRVFGTGTLIDSARYRGLLSQEVGIHPDDVRAYILGEHGDTQFPALSLALSGGEWVGGHHAARRLFKQTVRSGYEVVQHKGHTNFAIALATLLVIESIAHDSRRTVPVSTLIEGFASVTDVCLSIPVIIGRKGIVRQLHPQLDDKEQRAFRRSARAVRKAIRAIEDKM